MSQKITLLVPHIHPKAVPKSPPAIICHQSPTNPMNMRPMSQYIIRFFAIFFFSSSPQEINRLKSHQVNITTATPNTNTRKNATKFPNTPSNHAVSQNSEPPLIPHSSPPGEID